MAKNVPVLHSIQCNDEIVRCAICGLPLEQMVDHPKIKIYVCPNEDCNTKVTIEGEI